MCENAYALETIAADRIHAGQHLAGASPTGTPATRPSHAH